MTDQFPHTSRAGYHGVTLSPELTAYLDAVSDALVPGNDRYPSGSAAQVSTFIQDRVSDKDVELLDSLRRLRPVTDANGAVVVLAEMEATDPTSFAYLRELIYHGYYSSRRVLAAMADRGYVYHGAPQPLGYRITESMRMPSTARGGYISTEEVRRVSH